MCILTSKIDLITLILSQAGKNQYIKMVMKLDILGIMIMCTACW